MGNIRETIKKILEHAVNAPSGNNSQPWKFEVKENKIYIYNISDGDITPYNFDQKGSYIAHGALIENITIIASKHGYQIKTELFPEKNQPDLVATITIEKGSSGKEPLFDYILDRATDRRAYKKIALKLGDRDEILRTAKEVIGGGEIRLLEGREEIEKIAWALGLHERLIFENKMIHNIVFSKISWSEKEDFEKRAGLYIKTKFPDMPAFLFPLMKVFGKWSFVNIINKIGFPGKIQKQSAESCISSSALCAILVDSEENENFVEGGRLLQRIWLKATKMGLSIQPMTGIPYLARRILTGNSSGFSLEQIDLIREANKTVNEVFNKENKTIIMIFRVGYDAKLPVKTLKLPPKIVFEDKMAV